MNTVSEVAESPAVLDALVRRIAERFSPDKIILFGSRARGEAGPDSDVDLLVLFSEVPKQACGGTLRVYRGFPPSNGHRCFDHVPFRALSERCEHGVLAGFA
jgi:hypothetical protein